MTVHLWFCHFTAECFWRNAAYLCVHVCCWIKGWQLEGRVRIERRIQAVLLNFFYFSHVSTSSKQALLTKSATKLSVLPCWGDPISWGHIHAELKPYLTNQFLAPRPGKSKQRHSLIIIDSSLSFYIVEACQRVVTRQCRLLKICNTGGLSKNAWLWSLYS